MLGAVSGKIPYLALGAGVGGGDTSPLPGLVLNCHLCDSSGALLLFTQSCATVCNPMPGFAVLYYLLEFAQIHVV